MAGERLAKLTIQASWALEDNVRADQTAHVRFQLAGVWVDYYRGAYTSQNEFVVPDPDDVGRDYVLQGVQNLLALVKLTIQSRGLPYTVSDPRDLGNDLLTNRPKIAFDIEATQYNQALDLDFSSAYTGDPSGWAVLLKATMLQPLVVVPFITAATIYGSATGSITLQVTGGNARPLSYKWADSVLETTESRTNLKPGTYRCTVTDASGVSTVAVCVVKSDAQLAVLVLTTDSTISLVVSGGLPPYTYAWDDGPTTPSRQQLTPGTYYCLVSDARGASQRVKVVLEAYRYYWSQNPIVADLDAGDDYRLDPTLKPNLSFVCQVWVEPVYLSGTFVQVGPQLEQPADALGRTRFDVQALLDAFVSEHVPPDGQYVAVRADSLFRRFYLKTGEKFGTPPLAAALTDAQQHYVLLGGLAPEQAADGTWFGYQQAALPFLTWEPDFQRVLPTQPGYLYYQHLATGSEFNVWRRVQLLDGTFAPPETIEAVLDVRRFEVYCLRMGPAQLGLSADEVAGYQVWVADPAGVPLSQVRTYYLERTYYPNQRFFLYSNSLGGTNVLAALGQAKLGLEVKSELADRPAFDALLGDVAVLDRVGGTTLSVVSGPRRRAQVVADQELLLARQVRLLSGEAYWPGRVADATFVIRDEAEGLSSLSFDFVLARRRLFSPRLPQVLAGQAQAPIAGGEGAQP